MAVVDAADDAVRSSVGRLLTGGLAAVAASLVILGIADVGRQVWLLHAASVGAMLTVAVALALAPGHVVHRAAGLAAGLGVVMCALPLLDPAVGPHRWLALGPMRLYIAPVVIPAGLLVFGAARRLGPRHALAATAGLWALAGILAAHPDLSQVLALTAAASVLIVLERAPGVSGPWALPPLVMAVGVAAAQPDPLTPVSYVEDVFAVAWRHSVAAGLGVSASALFLVWTLMMRRGRQEALPAVGAYYAVLFGCSIAGLTPAPLIGFGAGPLLGFGLLAAAVGHLHHVERVPTVRGSAVQPGRTRGAGPMSNEPLARS